jgi:hypothetical protein
MPPIAIQPYRYPQLLKDEIENKCDDRLCQGIIRPFFPRTHRRVAYHYIKLRIIRPSTSPFSVTVFLIRKRDKSWLFCSPARKMTCCAKASLGRACRPSLRWCCSSARKTSWLFCVDYRTLNVRTVRDKFLIPVVDQLLDELKGACFFTKLNLCSGIIGRDRE